LLVLVSAVHGMAGAGPISPRQLVEVVDLGNPVISPDGSRVAFRQEQANVERETYDTVWYVQALDGSAPPRRVADGGVPLRSLATGVVESAPAIWSPDGRWIYYRALLDGKVAVWRAATDGSGAESVTADAADVRDFVLSPDGRALDYSVGATREQVLVAERAEHARGVRIDGTTYIGAGLFRSGQTGGRAITQRLASGWFTPGPLLSQLPDRWKRLDVDAQGADPADTSAPHDSKPDQGDDAAAFKQAMHPVDGRIARLTRVGDAAERRQKPYVELSMTTSAGAESAVRCNADLCTGQEITDIQWQPGSDAILFTVTDRREGRAQSIFRWDVVNGVVSTLVRSRGQLRGSSRRFFDVPCALSFATMVCVTTEADRPPRLEAIDLQDGRRRVLFDPNLGLAREIAASVPARLIRWTDERGDEFSGWLFGAIVKEGAPPPPLFVNYYSCNGFLRGGLGDEWPLTTMAAHGISALCINTNPSYLDGVESHAQGARAVESVVRHLAGQGAVDPGRVGMGGLSYGSEVTMWTLMYSDVLSAASVSTPTITPNWYLFNSLREGFAEMVMDRWQVGSVEDTPARWRTMSPVFNRHRINAPVLFQMSEQEYLLSLEYALPMLQENKADIYVFADQPHIKFGPKHQLAAYERNLDWFRFWLQGYERPGQAGVDQYRIWRSMRDAEKPGETNGQLDGTEEIKFRICFAADRSKVFPDCGTSTFPSNSISSWNRVLPPPRRKVA